MVLFCRECHGLLRKKFINGKAHLECNCGYIQQIDIEDDDDVQKVIEQKKRDLEGNLIVVLKEDKVSVHPTVVAECPKCKHTEAEAWQEQTRSADEPSTSFFRCTKCSFTWREY